MGKGKAKTGVPNKHLHARISFLQQAATYVALQGQDAGSERLQKPFSEPATSSADAEACYSKPDEPTRPAAKPGVPFPAQNEQGLSTRQTGTDQSVIADPTTPALYMRAGGLPHHLISNLRQVAQKSTIRLHSSVKRTLCRVCNAVLVEGQTCQKSMENTSRGGRKPHADVLVLKCIACGAKKRFPVGAVRQGKKGLREQAQSHQQERPEIVGHSQQATQDAANG